MNDKVMVPSKTPGMAWSLTVLRTQRGTVLAVANEVTPTPYGFEWDVFNARKVKEALPAKRLTAKVRENGIALLKQKLAEAGLTA